MNTCDNSPRFGSASCHLHNGHAGDCRARLLVGGELTFRWKDCPHGYRTTDSCPVCD